MEAMTSEREAFEKWADERGLSLHQFVSGVDAGDYSSDQTGDAWEGWQARAHLAQPAQAVDVGAIREVIAELESVVQTAKMPSFYRDNVASQIGKLTRALSGEKAGPVGDGWVSAMVDRFLGWRLPDDFSPDDGISFVPPKHPNSWPVGTNLFSVKQAEAMFRHALGALDGYVIVPAHRSEAEIRSFYGRMEGRTHD
jgi:hypothetical protein